jgi:double zinc ribbon protein
MTHPETTPAAPPPACASCGTPVIGRFCSQCGAAISTQVCAACQTQLSPGARFCHRCGAPARPASGIGGRERLAWTLTGLAAVAALLAFLYRGNAKPTVPDMGNAGNVDAPGTVPGLAQRAPDISNMSPRERFDRLWDRVVRAAEAGDSVTVIQFAPMALGAYSMMEEVDADARYHAATINLVIGDLGAALALADTIQAVAPGHLFADIVRGEVADRRNDAAALARSYREFLSHYDAELRAGRVEYAEHKPILDDFRTRAKASTGQ